MQTSFSLIRILFFLLLIPGFSSLSAQSDEEKKRSVWGDIAGGLGTSFSLPLGNLNNPDSSDNVSISLGITAPLRQIPPASEIGFERQGRQATNYALTAGVTYNPLSYWFINVTGYKYLDNAFKAPWHPDFSYRFGYDDWHPYTLSFVYGNYGGNRIFPDESKNEKFTRFEEGSFTLGWKFPLQQDVANIFLFDTTGAINHSINVSVVPTYLDYTTQDTQKWKTTINFATRYTIYEWWYLNFTLFYYPDISQRQPWDPDFTYGFGYFDWHSNTFSLQYNNYAGNRFPWSEPGPSRGGFLDGSISLMWGLQL